MVQNKRIGVVGTGFIGRGLVQILHSQDDLALSKILTRRNIQTMNHFPRKEQLTNSLHELIESSDLIVECSGDVFHATEVIHKAFEANLPVVTMNSELHITTGSFFVNKGLITEAEGDQPGSLAALKENVTQMGFKPLIYGNIKGFLNRNPTEKEMAYWAKKNHISIPMVTSFTDGTKLNIEQALVANGLDADIAKEGMLGPQFDDIHIGGNWLAEQCKGSEKAVSDYILSANGPAGVFITASHQANQQEALRYLKAGDGPYYTIVQNYHYCHLEIVKTIRRVLNGGGVLLNNSSNPSVSVAAIAKRSLNPGEWIGKGIGSFAVRGEAVKLRDNLNHVPIGLLANATITKPVEEGEKITFDDVEIPDSLSYKAWKKIVEQNKGVHSTRKRQRVTIK